MPLNATQRRFLKRQAHALKPVVTVGNLGPTDALREELDQQLHSHELLKLRVRIDDREARDEAIERLTQATGAELVGRVGNVAILYRAARPAPRLVLPN